MPRSTNPDLLVGFDTSDDAGVFRVSPNLALVQTMDFFTPVVDDPYDYGRIAAANALSDVYAMGGRPITAMNVACFDPEAAPAEVWAEIFRGMLDKTLESGAALVGGHSVEDDEPKFGLSVTGLVDPEKVFRNDAALAGDEIWLSKPLGTGIVTTAGKFDKCSAAELSAAIEAMATLNKEACEAALEAGVRCATDVTGFGLAGHLFNIARASGVGIELESAALPLLPGVERMVKDGCLPGGGLKNQAHLGEALEFAPSVPDWLRQVVVDPQTSGGLATMSRGPVRGSVRIGQVVAGPARIVVS